MIRHSVVLGLVCSAHVFGCAPRAGDLELAAQTDQPMLDAVPSTRSDVVGLLTQRGIEEQLCTGSLLLPNLVLTARHCLTVERAAIASGDCATAVVADPDPSTKVTVIPGTDIDLVSADAQRSVREYLLPGDEGRLCGQDLALLLLDQPISGTALVTPTATIPAADSFFAAVGYGLFDGDWGQQRQNSAARITCLGMACADSRIVEGELLTNAGACEGDSGGPAVDAAGKVFAIASRSTADCSTAAYLTLGAYFDWLKSGVAYAASNGGLALPAWASTDAIPNPSGPEALPAASNQDIRARGGGGCAVGASGAQWRLEQASSLLLTFGLALGACRRWRRVFARSRPARC